MQRVLRLVGCLAAVAGIIVVAAPSASAAVPTNDTFANATVAVPEFSQVIDTTQATTDADDAELNQSCGAAATDASVWYALDGVDALVSADASASDYSVNVMWATGSPGNFSFITCGGNDNGIYTSSGETYYIMLSDDQSDGGGNGGSLSIVFRGPPTIDVTIDPVGRVNAKSGDVVLTGTFTCREADFVDIDGGLTQQTKRFRVQGTFAGFPDAICDGTAQTWTGTVTPDAGKFVGGRAAAEAFGFACTFFDCAQTPEIDTTVRLKGSSG
jgi:hypothetical protein